VRVIVGITGASGVIYGIRLLEELRKTDLETHLVISKWGEETIRKETSYTVQQVKSLADVCHERTDLAAAVSSGSFKNEGMMVVPCSMKTLSGIANGYSEDLLVRAADVTIKEKRKLVLLTRETPLNVIHLENMLKLARIGVTIMPPAPAFYTHPQTLEEIVNQTVGRVLDQFGIEMTTFKRWS